MWLNHMIFMQPMIQWKTHVPRGVTSEFAVVNQDYRFSVTRLLPVVQYPKLPPILEKASYIGHSISQ
jgi:hypothetical protein